MHPEFPPISFLAAVAVLIPLPAYWRTRNIPMLSLIAWLFMLNVIFGVDALVWADNVRIIIPVWCDITTKLEVGGNIALPAACLCICIYLEQVSSNRVARFTFTDRKRRQIFEMFMCVLLPLVYMGLHFIVQGHRFDIIQGHGCRSTTYFSIPSIFLISIPPLLLSLLSLVYGALALHQFTARRVNFASRLTQSTLTPSQFLRLATMSILQMFWTIGISVYVLWFNVMATPLKPWSTWEAVHLNWLRIDLYAESSMPPVVLQAFYVIWWYMPVSTAIFVLLFACGEESREIYASAAEWVWTKVFKQKKWGHKKNFKLKAFILKKEPSRETHLPTLIKVNTSIIKSISPYPSVSHGDREYDFNYHTSSQYSSRTHLSLEVGPAPAYERDGPSTPSTFSSFPTMVTSAPHPSPRVMPIYIPQRIADPAELSRAIGPHTPSPSPSPLASHPPVSSAWPRAI